MLHNFMGTSFFPVLLCIVGATVQLMVLFCDTTTSLSAQSHEWSEVKKLKHSSYLSQYHLDY